MGRQAENSAVEQAKANAAWYCLRARRNQEQVAAAHVKVLGGTSIFCPRIRIRQRTRCGRIWITESLFPGYFFARFSLEEMLPRVRCAHGVCGFVRFGDRYPEVAESVIQELRAETEGGGIEGVTPLLTLTPSERARLVEGPLAGAVVTHVLPGHERVRLLLVFLGQETKIEAKVSSAAVAAWESPGSRLLKFEAWVGRGQRGEVIRER